MQAIIIGVAVIWGIPIGSAVIAAGAAAISPRIREKLQRSLAG
ncbi:hypothetical protein U1769_19790 [Sphingomonas sp. ZT3P38]